MNYMAFHKQWHCHGCFTIDEVLAAHPEFDPTDIARWLDDGDIVSLDKQGLFAFSTWKNFPDSPLLFAGKIRRPSYISMQTALGLHNIIADFPKAFTCVTTDTACEISNLFGDYRYFSADDSHMYGYGKVTIMGDREINMATPEKAVLDLLLFEPDAACRLKFDILRMIAIMNWGRLYRYAAAAGDEALNIRLEKFLRSIGL